MYETWLTNGNRIVWLYDVKRPVDIPFQSAYDIMGGSYVRYGFLDLLQIAAHIIRTKWMGRRERAWDGVKGTRLWRGVVCSELVGLALGRGDAHILTPAELMYLKELTFEREIETRLVKSSAPAAEAGG